MSQSSSKASWLRIPVSSTSSPVTAKRLVLTDPQDSWNVYTELTWSDLRGSPGAWSLYSRGVGSPVGKHHCIAYCSCSWRFAVSKTARSPSFDISKSFFLIRSPCFVALILPLLIALRKSAFNSFKVAFPIGKDFKRRLEQNCRSEASLDRIFTPWTSLPPRKSFAHSKVSCTNPAAFRVFASTQRI